MKKAVMVNMLKANEKNRMLQQRNTKFEQRKQKIYKNNQMTFLELKNWKIEIKSSSSVIQQPTEEKQWTGTTEIIIYEQQRENEQSPGTYRAPTKELMCVSISLRREAENGQGWKSIPRNNGWKVPKFDKVNLCILETKLPKASTQRNPHQDTS